MARIFDPRFFSFFLSLSLFFSFVCLFPARKLIFELAVCLCIKFNSFENECGDDDYERLNKIKSGRIEFSNEIVPVI